MDLYESMVKASRQRETKAEVVAYYKATYPAKGKGSWKQKIIHALSGMTGQKPKTLEKRFEKRMYDENGNIKEEPKNKWQYKDLGDMLPPMPPEKGYHLKGTIYVRYSECEPRDTFDIYITGENAEKFALNPNTQGVVNLYHKDDYDLTEEDGAYPACQEERNDFTVTAA